MSEVGKCFLSEAEKLAAYHVHATEMEGLLLLMADVLKKRRVMDEMDVSSADTAELRRLFHNQLREAGQEFGQAVDKLRSEFNRYAKRESFDANQTSLKKSPQK